MIIAAFIATGVVSFFVGSIPFGILIGKLFYGKDIRNVGSGNIGTTNAIRALGKAGGYAVFLLDFGKGLLSGFIALALSNQLLPSDPFASAPFPARADFLAFAFLCCTAGHIFTPWLGFKGGKGIAVAIGCLFVAFGPQWAIAEIALFAILVVCTRYVSVGSIAAAVMCAIISPFVFAGHPAAMIFGSATGALIVWAHRENITRLMRGEENRIGSKKETQ